MNMNRILTCIWCYIDKKHLMVTKRKSHEFSWSILAYDCSPNRRKLCAYRIASKVFVYIDLNSWNFSFLKKNYFLKNHTPKKGQLNVPKCVAASFTFLLGRHSLTYINIVFNQLCHQEQLVYWLGYWPSMQDILVSNLTRGISFLFMSSFFHCFILFLFELYFCIILSQSQTFSINTKNNHYDLFSCELCLPP